MTSSEHQSQFVGLITQHQTPLRAYIISLMPGIQGVSEVLQEVNLVLWEKRNAFELGTNFTAWAFSIARYETKAFKRNIQRKQHILSLDEQLEEQLADHCKLSPHDTDIRIQALECCMAKLHKDELQLIKHRYTSEITLENYAASLGKSAGSLRVTLHRIRGKLRKCISFQLQTTP